MRQVANQGTVAFDRPVTSCMHAHPAVAHPDTSIPELVRLLHDAEAVAIVDELENLVGVVSRTDLVALGAMSGRRGGTAMPLPARFAADVMTPGVVTIPSTASVRAAAQSMATHAIHQIYVVDDRLLLGVVGAIDIAACVRDAHSDEPLSAIMTAAPLMISTKTTLGAAIELLSRARVSGLVVLDEDQPVGTFTHAEAIEARDVTRATTIEELYEPAVLCVPATQPLHSVAAQLVRSHTQRVLACAEREVVGIATTLDFVRYVAC